MLLGFKTELKLNNKQKTLLAKSAGAARHAYNKGLAACVAVLEHNKQYPQSKLKFPSSVDLHKWLGLRNKIEVLWADKVYQGLHSLDAAWCG